MAPRLSGVATLAQARPPGGQSFSRGVAVSLSSEEVEIARPERTLACMSRLGNPLLFRSTLFPSLACCCGFTYVRARHVVWATGLQPGPLEGVKHSGSLLTARASDSRPQKIPTVHTAEICVNVAALRARIVAPR